MAVLCRLTTLPTRAARVSKHSLGASCRTAADEGEAARAGEQVRAEQLEAKQLLPAAESLKQFDP